MLWPAQLAVYYPHAGPNLSFARTLTAGLLLAALTVLVLGPGRRWPYLAVGWLWYLGTLVPVIGLVQVGGQALADRYSYVPLIGLFLVLSWGMADLAAAWRLPRSYLVMAAVLVLCLCALRTWNQVGCWESNRHLWECAVAATENNTMAHMNLGVCCLNEGRFTDALREFEKAVALEPRRAEHHVNLGNLLYALDLWPQAEEEYRTAIDLKPQLAGAHYCLGNALTREGKLEEAMAEFRRAIELNSNDPGPHINLGILLVGLGRREEALAEYHKALELGNEQVQPWLAALHRSIAANDASQKRR
jgi:tetratricopeptide (TPR) repeat protein